MRQFYPCISISFPPALYSFIKSSSVRVTSHCLWFFLWNTAGISPGLASFIDCAIAIVKFSFSTRFASMCIPGVDGEDTAFNFTDFPDILFTSDGFFDCRHILENYLPFDTLADTWQLLIKAERENSEINRMAADFRKMKPLHGFPVKRS